MKVGLGIDTGGTFTKLLLAASTGKVLGQEQVPTRPELGPKDYARRISAAVADFERRLGRKADAACLGIAGDIDPKRGAVRRSPNLKSFEGFAMAPVLKKALRRPVRVHNDANMAAWGVYAVEHKRRLSNVVAITMGTGIGGGIVLGGRLLEGSTGSAGEIGHMRVAPGGEQCACGARGCLEAYAGAAGIVRQARLALAHDERVPSPLREAGDLDPRRIAEAAQGGDELARAVFLRVGEALGVGIVNLVYLFNPDAVTLVGGVSQAGPLFLDAIRECLSAESFAIPFGHVRVGTAKAAQLGSIGAALFSLEGAD